MGSTYIPSILVQNIFQETNIIPRLSNVNPTSTGHVPLDGARSIQRSASPVYLLPRENFKHDKLYTKRSTKRCTVYRLKLQEMQAVILFQ